MRAVDTNVLVRALIDDDEAQYAAARAFVTKNEIFVPVTVVLESAWVLNSAMKIDRRMVIAVLRRFAGLPTVKVEDSNLIDDAFMMAEAGLDLADALHLSRIEQCRDLVTFDRALARGAKRLGAKDVTLLDNAITDPS